MKKNMCEDVFTPEGIPMTSPHDCGMSGPHNWKYDMWRMQCEQENMKQDAPAMACSAGEHS